MVNIRDSFFKHQEALQKLRDKKDVIALAIIKNPFEELTAFLHTTFCNCADEYYECRRANEWDVTTKNIVDKMETLLTEQPIAVTVSRKRKMQIED